MNSTEKYDISGFTGEVEHSAEELKEKERKEKIQNDVAKFLGAFDELNPAEKEFIEEIIDRARYRWTSERNEIRQKIKGWQSNIKFHQMVAIIDELPPCELYKLRNTILGKTKTSSDLWEILEFPTEKKR